MNWLRVAFLVALPAVAIGAEPEPEGYRIDEYRGAVPETLAGGTVVDTATAHQLWEDGGAAFVDVLPQAPKPDNLPAGTLWRDKPRHSIPGAIWLPNTGYGDLADVTLDYFLNALAQVTDDDPAHPLLFFCLEECWMSWNAAKRALAEGYTTVYWYPDGTDGWAFENYPLEQLHPFPISDPQ
jgi:PQQ-dependent catabolism-associated CXXCW motif protein